MRHIKGDLKLKKDTVFDESIKVDGDIRGYHNLTVKGNIHALNIVARNIDAWNIDARNIDARDIVCEKVNLKKDGKATGYSLTENRFDRKWKVLKRGDKK